MQAIKKLVQSECANHHTSNATFPYRKMDFCFQRGAMCIQVESDNVICGYFRQSVLPLDKALETQLDGGDLRKCANCRKPFAPTSNRQKYCGECSKLERRKKKAKRMRDYRAKPPKDKSG